MFKVMNMKEDPTEPPSTERSAPDNSNGSERPSPEDNTQSSVIQWVKNIVKTKQDPTLRETLEEYIDAAENQDENTSSISDHERSLIANVLKLRDHTVVDVMIPRADIFAIDITTSEKDLLSLLAKEQYSRIPVYRETLDNVAGTLHIKDILSCLADSRSVVIENLVREAPIVSPSMPVLDLLLMMKQMRKHMALVVDEFGGIDGLVTINDVIESIVGEIEDEYDQDDDPEIIANADGSLLADARFDIEEFEEIHGNILTADEREDVDTLGGLAFSIAGRVPARGEILTHSSGMVIEILEADPRRVNRLLIKNIPENIPLP